MANKLPSDCQFHKTIWRELKKVNVFYTPTHIFFQTLDPQGNQISLERKERNLHIVDGLIT